MALLSKERKKYLVEAMRAYHQSLPGSPGEEYLSRRGLTAPSVASDVVKFRLGYVADPLPGHEKYEGMLAIPYLRRSAVGDWSVVSMRFRCINPRCLSGEKEDHRGHGKYNSERNTSIALYNTVALDDNHDVVAICEGEFDAITATVCGVPAVGVPGVESWQPFYLKVFEGYRLVYILADNDKLQVRDGCTAARCSKGCLGHNPGLEFAEKVASQLSTSVMTRIVLMPEEHDVNSTVLNLGKRALLERIK